MERVFRIKLIAAVILLISIFSSLQSFSANLKSLRDNSNVVATKVFLKSMSELRNDLINEKKVGYVSEKEPGEMFNKESLAVEFILIQYSLIPVYVYNNYEYPLVIGNFHGKVPEKDFFEKRNLVVVKKYDNGLILLKNETKSVDLMRKQKKHRLDNMVL